jgi:hypothetical protein
VQGAYGGVLVEQDLEVGGDVVHEEADKVLVPRSVSTPPTPAARGKRGRTPSSAWRTATRALYISVLTEKERGAFFSTSMAAAASVIPSLSSRLAKHGTPGEMKAELEC